MLRIARNRPALRLVLRRLTCSLPTPCLSVRLGGTHWYLYAYTLLLLWMLFLVRSHGVALGHTSSTFVLAYTCPLRYVLDLITHLRFAVQNGTSLRPLFHLSMN